MTIFNRALLITLALLISHSVSAQNFRYFLRKANKEYELKAFNLAVDSYQQALAKDPTMPKPLEKWQTVFVISTGWKKRQLNTPRH
jgi:uncharacterized Fe-S cluster-containing radical SAM superfamily enzyme